MVDFNNNEYSKVVEASDWRYSAAIVGLIGYLDFFKCKYDKDLDYLYFNEEDINEDRFLEYAEYFFSEDMHHIAAERLIRTGDFDDEKIKIINGRLTGNVIMKKYFAKNKFNGKNESEILTIINENRKAFILETFRNKSNLYADYANTNLLFQEAGSCCRLVGYCIDMPKKGKELGYNFDIGKFVSNDDKLFDFIPFAFTSNREAVFVNDNSSINSLLSTNNELRRKIKASIGENESVNVRQILFSSIINSSDFIEDDVEVIVKNRRNEFFETMYIRRESIKVLKKIKDFKCFCWSFRVNENYYIDIQKEVTNAIINMTNVTELINILLNEDNGKKANESYRYSYVIYQLIRVNVSIAGGENAMRDVMFARKCAKEVTKKLDDNKIRAYRTKFQSALKFNDYKGFCDILIQLGNYVSMSLDFAYKLFADFENNKNIAYAFVNGLGDRTEDKNNKEE